VFYRVLKSNQQSTDIKVSNLQSTLSTIVLLEVSTVLSCISVKLIIIVYES